MVTSSETRVKVYSPLEKPLTVLLLTMVCLASVQLLPSIDISTMQFLENPWSITKEWWLNSKCTGAFGPHLSVYVGIINIIRLWSYVLWVVLCCPIQMLVGNAENADGPLVKAAQRCWYESAQNMSVLANEIYDNTLISLLLSPPLEMTVLLAFVILLPRPFE